MMKQFMYLILFASLLCVVGFSDLRSGPPQNAETSGLIELFAHDDRRATFSFRTRNYGRAIQSGRVVNVGGDLAFERYSPGTLAFGISAKAKAQVLKLGDVRDEATEHSAFPSIVWERGSFRVCEGGYESFSLGTSKFEEFPIQLSGEALDVALVPVELGAIYLARLESKHSTKYVKLRVIEYHPGQSTILRWEVYTDDT